MKIETILIGAAMVAAFALGMYLGARIVERTSEPRVERTGWQI